MLLPVIDLLGGVVVRGVAGQRAEYKPIVSRLAATAEPGEIALALARQFHFADVYVADLDAIAGRPPAWAAYEAIARAGLRMWLDAGIDSVAEARELAQAQVVGAPVFRLILGLESLASPEMLSSIASTLERDRLVFSLDLRAGEPLAGAAWRQRDPLTIASFVYQCGLRRMIVLDLARVGVGSGTGTEPLCREIGRRWPEIELIGGGGVRNAADVRQLAAAGISRVLVASALHDGGIQPQDIA